jgi:hypothetical protein
MHEMWVCMLFNIMISNATVFPLPELHIAWGYNWATWPQGDISSGDWISRLGVGSKASDLALENTSCYEISDKSYLAEKAKTHKGL